MTLQEWQDLTNITVQDVAYAPVKYCFTCETIVFTCHVIMLKIRTMCWCPTCEAFVAICDETGERS